MMGNEIEQIEELNRGLQIQSNNQVRLLRELDEILEKIEIEPSVLRALEESALESVESIPVVVEAIEQLRRLVGTTFEDGLGGIKGIAERMEFYASFHARFLEKLSGFFVSKFRRFGESFLEGKQQGSLTSPGGRRRVLVGHEELIPFLKDYRPLISVLGEGRRRTQVIQAYQTQMHTVFIKEYSDMMEGIKMNRIYRRSSEDKSHCTVKRLPTDLF